MASVPASPSSTMNDANAVDTENPSTLKQELVLASEAGRDINSPSQQLAEVEIAAIKTTGAASEELSMSTEITADIALPSSSNASTRLSSENTRVESQPLRVSTALKIGSPSLITGRSNEITSESISSETQEIVELNDARRINTPSYSEDNGLNTIARAMANPQIEELEGSTEAIASIGHFNPDVDPSALGPNFIDSNSLKEQEQIVSATSTNDVGSSRLVTEGQNGTAKVLETISLPSSDIMAMAEVARTQDLLSSGINTSIMAPELIEASTVQESELPFGPFSVEGTPEVESPSLALETPTTNDVCKPMELDGAEMHSQPTLKELALDTMKNPELIELRSTETPKHDSSNGLESTEVSPNITLSSHPASSTYSGDDALKYGLAKFLEANNSSKASSELDTSRLEVCDAKHPSEAIQASFKETPELASTTAISTGKVSPSLASSEATVVPENLEMVRPEIQEYSTLAEAVPDAENPHNSAGVFNIEPGFVDKKVTGTTEPIPPSEDTLKLSSSSSPPAPLVVTLNTPEVSLVKTLEGPSSETSSSLSSPSSWIGDANEFSKGAETSTFQATNLPLAAGNHHGSNNDGTQLRSFEDGTAACGPANTMIKSPEEDVEMDLKSTMPGTYSHLNSGWAFAELGQNRRDDMKTSDQFKMDRQASSKCLYGMNSPTYSGADIDVPSLFDEEATIHVPRLDVPAAHTQKIEPSIADELTTTERIEFMLSKVEDWSVPGTTLNNPPLSLGNIKGELDIDNKNMDETYSLVESVDTGVKMQQPQHYEMPNTWKYEPVVKSSPEIKMEPISMKDIPYLELLPLATADHKSVPRLIEEWSPKIREGAPSPEATPHIEAKPLTLKTEPREPNLIDMQLLPFSISKDTYSSRKSPEDTDKCSRKRARDEVEDIGEVQKRSAKKLYQQLVDIPQVNFKKSIANKTIELHVGPTNKCILAEKHILAKSPFFALLFNQKVSRAYQFPRFDTYALATIVHWLHYGNIQSIAEDYKADEIFHTTHMIKVHLLCSKLQLRSLMDLAVELLGHGYLKNKSAPTIEEIDITYSETDQVSGLRIYMAAWARCREHAPLQKFMMAGPWHQIRFKALCKKHPDLLKDMKNLDESSDPESPISLNPRFHEICWYHDHPHGEQCGVSGKTFETACSGIEPRLYELI